MSFLAFAGVIDLSDFFRGSLPGWLWVVCSEREREETEKGREDRDVSCKTETTEICWWQSKGYAGYSRKRRRKQINTWSKPLRDGERVGTIYLGIYIMLIDHTDDTWMRSIWNWLASNILTWAQVVLVPELAWGPDNNFLSLRDAQRVPQADSGEMSTLLRTELFQSLEHDEDGIPEEGLTQTLQSNTEVPR